MRRRAARARSELVPSRSLSGATRRLPHSSLLAARERSYEECSDFPRNGAGSMRADPESKRRNARSTRPGGRAASLDDHFGAATDNGPAGSGSAERRHAESSRPKRNANSFVKNSQHVVARTWLSPVPRMRANTFISSTRTPR